MDWERSPFFENIEVVSGGTIVEHEGACIESAHGFEPSEFTRLLQRLFDEKLSAAFQILVKP